MAIVSDSWVVTEQGTIYCYWPNYVGQSKLNKLIIEHTKIEFDKSQKCAVNIKYKSSKLIVVYHLLNIVIYYVKFQNIYNFYFFFNLNINIFGPLGRLSIINFMKR